MFDRNVGHSSGWYEPDDLEEPVGFKVVFVVKYMNKEEERFYEYEEALKYLKDVEEWDIENWKVEEEEEPIWAEDDYWARDWDD